MTEELRDAEGKPLGTYRRDRTGDVSWVLFRSAAPAEQVAPAALRAFGGERFVTDDDDLAGLLVAGGGRVQRRARDYAYDLRAVPPEWASDPGPPGFRLHPEIHPELLAAAHAAAYPAGHPDYEHGLDHEDDVRTMAEGRMVGPIVPEATWEAVHATAGPCGAILVCDRPDGDVRRCWVLDVFVDPEHHGQGLGGALLRRSLAGAAAAGYAVMGLVVTDGNPARAAYEAVGFTLVRAGTNVEIPPVR